MEIKRTQPKRPTNSPCRLVAHFEGMDKETAFALAIEHWSGQGLKPVEKSETTLTFHGDYFRTSTLAGFRSRRTELVGAAYLKVIVVCVLEPKGVGLTATVTYGAHTAGGDKWRVAAPAHLQRFADYLRSFCAPPD